MSGKEQAAGAKTAVLFSRTEDIWQGHLGATQPEVHYTMLSHKRALYIALKHLQLPLDVIIEEDLQEADVMVQYRQLYVTDMFVSTNATAAIARWVTAGGVVLATAGAALRDEFNRTNTGAQQVSVSLSLSLSLSRSLSLSLSPSD